MLPYEQNQRFAVQVTLGTGDASKDLMAAVSGVTYFVTRVIITSLVAAAQVAYVGDSSGTVKALSLAASLTANAQLRMESKQGLGITAGEALVVKPAAAGPSFHVIAEGYIVRS